MKWLWFVLVLLVSCRTTRSEEVIEKVVVNDQNKEFRAVNSAEDSVATRVIAENSARNVEEVARVVVEEETLDSVGRVVARRKATIDYGKKDVREMSLSGKDSISIHINNDGVYARTDAHKEARDTEREESEEARVLRPMRTHIIIAIILFMAYLVYRYKKF